MRSGSFDISQEGVDEMVYQLPLVVRNCSCSQLRESERTDLQATTTSSNKEVIQQDNDCHNDEDMNEW
jgi:hypothetical protein